jgi:nucleoside-diphosphate-sugar epimerase
VEWSTAGREPLTDIIRDCDAVYLTIAPGRTGQSYEDVYLRGAELVVGALRDSSVNRLIYTSSTRVYGESNGGWVDEQTPPVPSDENGRILLAAEDMLLSASQSLSVNVTVVRLGGIHGPQRVLADRIRSHTGTTLSGGDGYVNLIHRDVIVDALVQLIDVDHNGVLNLVDATPTTRRELYDRIIADAGLKPIRWVDDGPDDKGKRVSSCLVRELLNLDRPTAGGCVETES